MKRHSKAPRRATDADRRGGCLSRRGTHLGAALLGTLILALLVGVTAAAAAAPTVTIEDATAVSYTSAHAEGKVDPQGQPTTYRLQYLNDTQLQENIANGLPEWESAQTAREGTVEGAEQAVEADLAGLTPGATYHLRLVGENADGASEAVAVSTFSTEPVGPPTLTIVAPTGIDGTAAHLSGTINPQAPAGNPSVFDVAWQLQLSADGGASWSLVSGGTIAADSSSHTVEADATGLDPGKAYEVRLAATNAGSTATAGPEAFSEPALGPVIAAVSANPSQHEANLQGSIDPNGAATTYHFDYGSTTAYGQSTSTATIPAGNGVVQINSTALGLTPSTGYHYRLVVENSAGGTESGDHSLTTLSVTPPAEGCSNAAIRREQGSTWLPECRAFEMVNPPGLDVGEVVKSPATSNDGERVAWQSPGLPESALGGSAVYMGAAFRGPSGWTTKDANVLQPEGVHVDPYWRITAFSQDFTRQLRGTTLPLDPSDPGEQEDIYRVQVGTGIATSAQPRADGSHLEDRGRGQ